MSASNMMLRQLERNHMRPIKCQKPPRQQHLQNCKNPKTRSSKKQILFETLQSVQSVELFNFKRAPRARERQGTPCDALGCKKSRTQRYKKQVLFETLQSVQSVELFNFKRTPRARERQGTPGSAREAPNPYIYLKNAPDL